MTASLTRARVFCEVEASMVGYRLPPSHRRHFHVPRGSLGNCSHYPVRTLLLFAISKFYVGHHYTRDGSKPDDEEALCSRLSGTARAASTMFSDSSRVDVRA